MNSTSLFPVIGKILCRTIVGCLNERIPYDTRHGPAPFLSFFGLLSGGRHKGTICSYSHGKCPALPFLLCGHFKSQKSSIRHLFINSYNSGVLTRHLMLCNNLVAMLLTQELQISSLSLLPLNSLKQTFKVSSPKTVKIIPLNDLNEHSWPIHQRLSEKLQQVSRFIKINQNI
jgi:hypothetical protein